MTDIKMTVTDYIETFPKETQNVLEKMRQIIQQAVPDAIEKMSYGIPTYDLNGTHLIFFAGWKNHVSIYPLPKGHKALQEKLAPYTSGQGTAKFPLDKPIPYDLIQEIASSLVKEKQT